MHSLLQRHSPLLYAPTSFLGWAGGVLRLADLAGVGAGLLSLESSVMPTISSSSEESSMTTAAALGGVALGGVALRCDWGAGGKFISRRSPITSVQTHKSQTPYLCG